MQERLLCKRVSPTSAWLPDSGSVAGRICVQSGLDRPAKTEAEGLQLRQGLQSVAGRIRIQTEFDGPTFLEWRWLFLF